MPCDKERYIKRFVEHAEHCVRFAERYLSKSLPKDILCNIGGNYLFGIAQKEGHVKYIGGRLLKPDQLRRISVYRAAKLTYSDGKIPRWINLYYECYDDNYSYIEVLVSRNMVDEESKTMNHPSGAKQIQIFLSNTEILKQE